MASSPSNSRVAGSSAGFKSSSSEKSKIVINVGESTTKVYLCDFNGGCGQKFETSTDLLDHVAIHLDEQTVIIKLNDPPKGQGNDEQDPDLAPYEMDFRMCFSEQELAEVLGSSFEFDESQEMEGGGGSEAGPGVVDSLNAGSSGVDKSDGGTWGDIEDFLCETASSEGEELRAADDHINWDEFFETFSPDLKLSLLENDAALEDTCCGETSMDLFCQEVSTEEEFEEAEVKTEGVEDIKTNMAGPEDSVVKLEDCADAQKVPKKKLDGKKNKNVKLSKSKIPPGVIYEAEYILAAGLIKHKRKSPSKPYLCPVPGCGKCYKNPNGIKYHAKYGHSAPQEFYCTCGKIYSTRHGLMAHIRQRRDKKLQHLKGLVSCASQED